MNKSAGLLLLATLSHLGPSLSYATQAPQQQLYAAASKKASAFLFTVYAQKGSLKPDGKGQFILDMKLPDIDQVIVFGDRPSRFVQYISGAELQQIWVAGKNSFAIDPPNASLAIAGLKPAIVTLSSIEVKNGHAYFRLQPTDIGPRLTQPDNQASYITLTIDDVTATSIDATCTFQETSYSCIDLHDNPSAHPAAYTYCFHETNKCRKAT